MLTPKANPLLTRPANADENGVSFDAKKLKSPFSTAGTVPTSREIRKLYRVETAAEAIGNFPRGGAVFGVTKGQIPLIEIIAAVLARIGPAEIFVSTWHITDKYLSTLKSLIESGLIRRILFLMDLSFQRRQPHFAAMLRELIGADAIKVSKNHAKFALLKNQKWSVVLKTSLNFYSNPCFENFELSTDQQCAVFLENLKNEIFKK